MKVIYMKKLLTNFANIILDSYKMWIIGTIIVFFAYMFMPKSCRYKIASSGKNNAIVIDTYTGEAWITDKYEIPKAFSSETEEITYLKPVGYCDQQKEAYKYTPDEKRNNRNTTWYIWLSRKLCLA